MKTHTLSGQLYRLQKIMSELLQSLSKDEVYLWVEVANNGPQCPRNSHLTPSDLRFL